MRFGGIWSFIIGAQVAFSLLFVPAAVGIFTNTLHVSVVCWVVFPTERYLTFRLRIDNEAMAGDRRCARRWGRLGHGVRAPTRRSPLRLREEPGVTEVTLADRRLGYGAGTGWHWNWRRTAPHRRACRGPTKAASR